MNRVIIVGGGISGISTAYFLTEKGFNNVVVVEEKYLASGSTGGCASGIRASFTSREHVILMRESIELWGKLSQKLGFFYERGGYLWLISSEESLKYFKELSRFHNSLGVPTRLIDVEEVEKIIPIKVNGLIGALHDPIAGKANPFKSVEKMAEKASSRGATIHTWTRASKIVTKGSKVIGVETDKGFIEGDKVLIAAGSETRKLLLDLGINIPLKNVPHHALITETFKPTLKPLVIDWDNPSKPYLVQVEEGGFLMGMELEEEPDTPLTPRIDFLPRMIKSWSSWFPWLRNINVLRYWVRYYVISPDHHPILGPVEDYEGLYVAAGFSGHGFMMGPITGKLLAEWILDGKPSVPEAENLTFKRIVEGRLIEEKAVIG